MGQNLQKSASVLLSLELLFRIFQLSTMCYQLNRTFSFLHKRLLTEDVTHLFFQKQFYGLPTTFCMWLLLFSSVFPLEANTLLRY
ncbi:hypothetical protein SDC9_172505 [bioreactor metagenome]|uniref:Uncharacterized protein n=1 Tax=bioreactor metagenome TaxID=1076179 RepID=A0A645GDX2_9ZZZZ